LRTSTVREWVTRRRKFLRENWKYLRTNYDLGTQFLKVRCYYDSLAYRRPDTSYRQV
jgi:hypothetical protein